jgi:hypothetical protein
MWNSPSVSALAVAILLAHVPPLPAAAQAPPDREAMLRSALSAAPPTLRDTVKVMDFDGNVLRDGPPG